MTPVVQEDFFNNTGVVLWRSSLSLVKIAGLLYSACLAAKLWPCKTQILKIRNSSSMHNFTSFELLVAISMVNMTGVIFFK